MINLAGDGAVMSACCAYRYRLDRHVGAGDKVYAFFGVNPSTADAETDDATVKKWRGFSRRLGVLRFIVGNAFAYRATDVRELKSAADPVGPEWRMHMEQIISEADVLVACWGASEKLPAALKGHLTATAGALRGSGKPVKCWGLTATGEPRHPLMLPYTAELEDFTFEASNSLGCDK